MRALHRGLAAALALLLGACTQAAPVMLAAEPHALDDYGLALRLPSGWQVREREGGLRWQARPLDHGQPVAGVYFLVDRDSARVASEGLPEIAPTLDSYVTRSEALARKDSRRYGIADEGRLLLDGLPAVWHLRAYASYTMARRSYAVMTVRGRNGYLLAGAAPEADYARWDGTFRAIAASLRWLPSD